MEFQKCVCVFLTSLRDASALPSHTSVSQEPPLPLHPHLTLQVMFLWDLKFKKQKIDNDRGEYLSGLSIWTLQPP